MTRQEMIETILKAARDNSGCSTDDPVYIRARAELERHTDTELALLVEGVETDEIYEAARRVNG